MADVMDRRKFLRGLIAAPIAAVAVKAMIETKFVPELKAAAVDELATIEGETLEHQLMKEALETRGEVNDADEKIFVRAPQKVFNPDARIWKSVVNEAEGWAAAIAITHPDLNLQSLQRSTKILARAIDRDIKSEEITAGTDIIIELPKVLRTWRDSQGRMQAEIAMGLDKIEVRGIEQFKVGYIGNHGETSPNMFGIRQGTRQLDDHLNDAKIYQPERQIRAEMQLMRDQYLIKEQKIDSMREKRQDEIVAHDMNDQMERKGWRAALDAKLDNLHVETDHEVSYRDMKPAEGWARSLSKLLWG